MITKEEYTQLKAFARVDGLVVGILWIVSFAFFIGGYYNPLMSPVSLAFGVVSIVVAVVRLRRFRDNVLGGIISFRRAWGYGMLVFFYAALLMAISQFAYFQLLDGGFLLNQYVKMSTTPEFKSMMQGYGMTPSDMRLAFDTLAKMRPIDIAIQFLSMNIIIGIIISMIAAACIRSVIELKK